MTTVQMSRSALTPRRRWVETEHWRHAYDGAPMDPGDVIEPLCDPAARVVVVVPTVGQPAPECPGCDIVWRVLEGVPLRTGQVLTTRPSTDTPARAVPSQCRQSRPGQPRRVRHGR
jgi:hypothetical protein